MADPTSPSSKSPTGLGVFDSMLSSGTEAQANKKASPVKNSDPSHTAKPARGLGAIEATMQSGDEVTANQKASPGKNATLIAKDLERHS